MLLFRALATNMAPMTNADESSTNRLTLFPIYLSLFIVSTLCFSLYFQKITFKASSSFFSSSVFSFTSSFTFLLFFPFVSSTALPFRFVPAFFPALLDFPNFFCNNVWSSLLNVVKPGNISAVTVSSRSSSGLKNFVFTRHILQSSFYGQNCCIK